MEWFKVTFLKIEWCNAPLEPPPTGALYYSLEILSANRGWFGAFKNVLYTLVYVPKGATKLPAVKDFLHPSQAFP